MTGNEYQKAALRTANMNYSEYSMIITVSYTHLTLPTKA